MRSLPEAASLALADLHIFYTSSFCKKWSTDGINSGFPDQPKPERERDLL
jgi:hypothetical protein